MNEDLSRETLEIRKSKLGQLKELKKQGFIAFFRGGEIISYQRKTTPNDKPQRGNRRKSKRSTAGDNRVSPSDSAGASYSAATQSQN